MRIVLFSVAWTACGQLSHAPRFGNLPIGMYIIAVNVATQLQVVQLELSLVETFELKRGRSLHAGQFLLDKFVYGLV